MFAAQTAGVQCIVGVFIPDEMLGDPPQGVRKPSRCRKIKQQLCFEYTTQMGRCINRQKTVYSADNIITRALAVYATAHPGQEGGEKRTGIASDFVLYTAT